MKNFAARAVTVAASFALAIGVLPGAAASGSAATTVPVAVAPTTQIAAAKSATKISLKASAKSFHRGQTGPKIAVTVKTSGKAARGKVTFYDGKKKIKTVKLKKGKAAIRLKSSLKVGKHTIRVKHGKVSKSVKIRVHNSSLTVNSTAFTVSKADPSGYNLDEAAYALRALTGTVKYRGKAAKTGYVDIYRNGKTKGGASSPNYIAMASVSNGKFTFSSSWLYRIGNSLPVGTHKFKAFYTPGAAFKDYVHSSWITVTVTD